MKEQRIKMLIAVMIFSITVGFAGIVDYGSDISTVYAAELVTKTTTMECSVWSAPNTEEQYRVKKIPAGYDVTVYPEVVESIAGDGKTFYQTSKGCYILCKCFEEAASEKQESPVEVLAEYTLQNGWYTRRFMIIKNNSSDTLDISTASLAYAGDGQMLAAANSRFYALGGGCVSIMYETYKTNDGIGYYETSVEVSKSRYYKSVIQDLSYTQNNIEGGVIFQVTNHGEYAAEFVVGYVLFFSGDRLVDYDYKYFTDNDSEIKPGRTISKQFNSYKDFDRVEFYMTGRR